MAKKKKIEQETADIMQEPETVEEHEDLVTLSSTQMWSPVKDLRDGIVLTKDERYVQIMEISPINFDLRPDKEKFEIADAFGDAIRSFPQRFQIKILTQRANVDDHIRDIQEYMQTEENEFCRQMQSESIETARKNAEVGISRRFFIAYDYDRPAGLRKPTWHQIRSGLLNTASRINQSLMGPPCGNHLVNSLDNSQQTMDILYNCMCRSEAESKSLDGKLMEVLGSYLSQGRLGEGQLVPVNDFIAPKVIDHSNPKYLKVDDKYYSFGYIERRSYPQHCLPGWISSMINMGEGIDVDIFVEKVPSEKVNQKLELSMRATQVSLNHAESTSSSGIDNAKKLQSGMYLQEGLANNDELCYFSIMLSVVADTPEELKDKTAWVKNTLWKRDLRLKFCNFHQDEAFKATLPLNKPDMSIIRKAHRNILSSDFGAAYPFTSYEVNDSGGILFGYNTDNLSPVYINPFDRDVYENGNMALLGVSGIGKTYLLMLMAFRLRQQKVKTIIIAPYKGHEFRRGTEAIGGEFISLAPGSPQNINVMEIRKYDTSAMEAIHGSDYAKSSILAAKLTQLHTFFSLLLPNMSHIQKQQLDEALMRTYARFGITMKNKSLVDPKNPKQYKPMPILGDLYEELKKKAESPEYGGEIKILCAALRRFVDGSAKSFNAPTNVNLDNDLVVIDVSSMSKEMLPIGMFIATDFSFDTIKADVTKRKALIMDELSRLIGVAGTAETGEFVLEGYKTVRAFNTIAIAATQDVGDFFAQKDGVYGKGILNNSKIHILMRQEEYETKGLADMMNLSEVERDALPYFVKGEALVIANRNHVKVKVVGSPMEHRLITTDADELIAIATGQQ